MTSGKTPTILTLIPFRKHNLAFASTTFVESLHKEKFPTLSLLREIIFILMVKKTTTTIIRFRGHIIIFKRPLLMFVIPAKIAAHHLTDLCHVLDVLGCS